MVPACVVAGERGGWGGLQRGRAFVWGSSRQAPLWKDFWPSLWENIARMVRDHNIEVIGGDFGMALFKARGALQHLGVQATFLGSWAWRQLRDNRGGGEAIPGIEGLRFDSLGLYAVVPVQSCQRLITPAMLSSTQTPQTPDFCEFEKGPGCGAASCGGAALVKDEFEPVVTGRTHDAEQPLPPVKQKAVTFLIFDGEDRLLTKEAHMPLLFFVGERGKRSEDAAARRNAERRQGKQGKGKGKGKVQQGAKRKRRSGRRQAGSSSPRSRQERSHQTKGSQREWGHQERSQAARRQPKSPRRGSGSSWWN